MTGILLIRDLAIVLVIAGIAAWVCQRLGLSVVVGYLVAGAIIGPFTPPFALVTDADRVQTLAQIGLVFLIFSIGLNLSLSRLKRLGLSTVLASLIGALLVLIGCRVFGWAIGWTTTASLFLAGMLMVSSSAIISKVLDELKLSHERPGQLALAVTVFEDIVAITMLTLLSSLVALGGDKPQSLWPTLSALGAFVLLLAMMSLLMVPRLLGRLTYGAQPEVRTVVVGGILLSLSWLAVELGYSLALGAFIFGVIVGSTRYKSDIERSFDGLRQMFGAVFFVAVGMMVDFKLLVTTWPLLLGVTALALILRPLACSFGFIVVGNSTREAIQAGLTLTPLGEFTFVIAQLGVQSGALSQSAYPVAAGAALLTALAAPVLTRHGESMSRRIADVQPAFLRARLTTYREWVRRLQGRQAAGIVWQLSRRKLLQVGMVMGLVSALLVFIRPIFNAAKGVVGTGPLAEVFPPVFWGLFGLVLLAPLIAIWRNVSALSMIFAEGATTGARRPKALRPLLERLFRAAALVLLALWLLTVLPSGWSLFGAAGGVLLLLMLVAAVFWRRFIKLQSKFEIDLLKQLHRASQVTSASAWPDLLPQQTSDWDCEINEVTLPADSAHVGRTLRQLSLRPQYGCSVVGIDRQGYSIVNPSADTVLYPDDKLLLLGGHDELVRASRDLLAIAPAVDTRDGFDELTMETVRVPEGSPLAGKTLLELDLIGKYGIQIGGIRRGSQQNLSPGGRDHFKPGDELLLLGNDRQIREFSRLLEAPPSK